MKQLYNKMNTQNNQIKAIKEMQAVKKNPFYAIQMLATLNDEQADFSFVGFTKYFLNYNGMRLNTLTQINPFRKRSKRLKKLITHVDECWKNGFIDDRQRKLLILSLNLINNTIKHYFLIYICL